MLSHSDPRLRQSYSPGYFIFALLAIFVFFLSQLKEQLSYLLSKNRLMNSFLNFQKILILSQYLCDNICRVLLQICLLPICSSGWSRDCCGEHDYDEEKANSLTSNGQELQLWLKPVLSLHN